ncbi:Putative beta-barrel porin-2, OmpL-like. bbp2 [Desulfurobacterium pacificum]|uniref:Beta-barrel porin-2, OmpL-like. bbp2 n=1 Tax=Desulfurobacterium pacificum TaxID=240166 RepID=A0ABY1NKH1_9BACT|nr:outer membrane beta-barrel protein [Desulfurobacterium pacificum]SMP11906.1 Putative beta-barrel porin-2, OmpL-like. bbp2 [Desulfurobacterium pacificum]
MRKGAKAILTSIILATVSYSTSMSAELKMQNVKLNVKGGITTTEFFETRAKTDGSSSNDLKLSDAILNLEATDGISGADFGLGTITEPTVLSSANNDNTAVIGEKTGIVWGFLYTSPFKNFKVEAGLLPTNVGYELAATYLNPNIVYGFVWNSQPFIYKGARVTYSASENFSLYAEYDKGKELNGNPENHAFAVGSIGSVDGIGYTVTYFDYANYKNLIDFTLSTEYKNFTFAINGDYQWLDKDNDKKGYGIAAYIIPTFGKLSIPLRVEYVKDTNNSGIYGFSKPTYSVTLTPTWKLSYNSKIRIEYSYAYSSDNTAFNGSNHKGTASFQLLFMF